MVDVTKLDVSSRTLGTSSFLFRSKKNRTHNVDEVLYDSSSSPLISFLSLLKNVLSFCGS